MNHNQTKVMSIYDLRSTIQGLVTAHGSRFTALRRQMRKEKKLMGSFVLAFVLLSCIVPVVAGQGHRFRGRREFLPYTRNLPAIDKIELLKLKLVDDRWDGGIAATKVLKGAKAQQVASLWRRQTYTSSDAACHEPAYAIKFYYRGRLIAHASICWSCNNMYFLTPHFERQQTFLGGNRRGEELSEVFRVAFK